MSTRTVGLLLSVFTFWLTLGAGAVEAQTHEAPSRQAHAEVRLASEQEMTLTFPRPEEYALPITGAVLGGAALAGGVGMLLFVGFVSLIGAAFDADNEGLVPYLVGGLGGAAVGGLVFGLSIAELLSLRDRRRAARDAAVTAGFVVPTSDGVMVGAVGSF